jgi:uncharacterized membrane protein YGL010W
MRTADDWFLEYGEGHRHAANKLLHWICVPAIVLSVIGLLWVVPVPRAWREISPGINWASIAMLAVLLYYSLISLPLALGMIPVLGVMSGAVLLLAKLPWPLGLSCAGLLAAAWIGQFIGHAIEGRRPSFFKDLQFLLIGPLWLLGFVYRRFGIAY